MIRNSLAAVAAFAAMTITSSAARAEPLDGTFRGTFVCEQIANSPDILHVPLDMIVKAGNVTFARPRFNLKGTRVLGSELSTGTVDADGKVHLTSTFNAGGFTFEGDYTGTLTASGGTLSGKQSWRNPQGNGGSRTCAAAFVPAPKLGHAAAAQE